jgi:hypothetical protein
MQQVVLGVDGDQAHDLPAVPRSDSERSHHQVQHPHRERVAARPAVGAGEHQAHHAGRDVHEVVPAVHVEDADHGVARNVVAG